MSDFVARTICGMFVWAASIRVPVSRWKLADGWGAFGVDHDASLGSRFACGLQDIRFCRVVGPASQSSGKAYHLALPLLSVGDVPSVLLGTASSWSVLLTYHKVTRPYCHMMERLRPSRIGSNRPNFAYSATAAARLARVVTCPHAFAVGRPRDLLHVSRHCSRSDVMVSWSGNTSRA